MKLSKQELMQKISDLVGEENKISVLEDLQDSIDENLEKVDKKEFDDLQAKNNDLQTKYDDLQKRYKDRFFSGEPIPKIPEEPIQEPVPNIIDIKEI